MPSATIIHVVDDDELFKTAISRVLRAAGYEVRGYANAGEFLVAGGHKTPGCILLDVRLPGPSGLELQEALARDGASLPIIFLSAHGSIPTTVRAIKAGAVDFLTKPVKRETLLGAIQAALAFATQDGAVREQHEKWRACYEALTERERQVFERVVSGKMNKEIAGDLGAAERTVKAHRAQVMQKMHATSLAELVHIADELKSSPPLRASNASGNRP